jgi:hypothetical protein
VRCVDIVNFGAFEAEIPTFYLLFRPFLLFISYARERWVIFLGEVEMKYAQRGVAIRIL